LAAFGSRLSRELAAGKLLALVDRAEAKDALDLWAICHIGGLPLPEVISIAFIKDPGLGEAPQFVAGRLRDVGKELPGPLPPVEPAVEPEVVQRWFADEATAMWRRLRPDVTPRP
jgi:hypothetical protein